jgi:hypothetical protein
MALTIEELPFRQREPLELFGIDRSRTEPDLTGDFAEYGWVTLPEVALASASAPPTVLRDTLVLALHSPELDNPAARTDELEVELEVRLPDGELVNVLAPLVRFLDARAASVIGDAHDVLLAFCNPLRLPPRPPAWLVGSRRLHFAEGNVVSWLDRLPDGRERIRLTADRWRTLTTAPPAHDPMTSRSWK